MNAPRGKSVFVRWFSLFFGLSVAFVAGCRAPSPPVDANAGAPLPPGSMAITRDGEGAPPKLDESGRAAHEADALALLDGHVSLPSESGAVIDWRGASITVESIDGPADAAASSVIRHRYELAVSELAACYRRLSAGSAKGEAKARVRVDAMGQPTRVEWRSGRLPGELYPCTADTLLAIRLPPAPAPRLIEIRVGYQDR